MTWPTDRLFDALEEVTTVPALALAGGESMAEWDTLLRGEDKHPILSASALPRVPETGGLGRKITYIRLG